MVGVVCSAVSIFHFVYIAFQSLAQKLGVRGPASHWWFEEMWIGSTATISYHCGRAAAYAMEKAAKAHVHVEHCRWVTGAIVFVYMWMQEDCTAAFYVVIALQPFPDFWWFGKRARVAEPAAAPEPAQRRPRSAQATPPLPCSER